MPKSLSLAERLREEFGDWVAHHPNASLFDWEVAASNVADHFVENRDGAEAHLDAHRMAAEEATRRCAVILQHVQDRNYGLAEDALDELIESGLPNDHGGPVTHYPIFDDKLAVTTAARRRLQHPTTVVSRRRKP